MKIKDWQGLLVQITENKTNILKMKTTNRI